MVFLGWLTCAQAAQSCFLWQLLAASSAFYLSAASPSLFYPPGLSPVWPGRLPPSPTLPVWEFLPTMLWFLLWISTTIPFWGWKLWLGIVDLFLFLRILAVSTHLILCNLYFNLQCFLKCLDLLLAVRLSSFTRARGLWSGPPWAWASHPWKEVFTAPEQQGVLSIW